MESTTFTLEIIPQINKVLKFVLENPYSDFYRKKYEGSDIKEIKSYEDFQKIPFLTKDEFLAIAIKKRTFVPEEEIKYYSFSSGTTNQTKPAIIPHSSLYRTNFARYGGLNGKKFQKLGVKNLLVLMPPLSPAFIKYISMLQKRITVIPGDVRNLGLTAKIAKELHVEAVSTTSTILEFFIEELKKIDFDFGRIKWISLGGEFFSPQRFSHFKSLFPNALFKLRYGMSEIGGFVFYKCDFLAKSGALNDYHFVSSGALEMVGDKNAVLPLGDAGEIVYTDLEAKAFPLIRYKTRDTGILNKATCPCGQNHIFIAGGRAEFSSFKFYGTKVTSEMIEKALAESSKYLAPRFQMHVFEEKTEGGLKPKLRLHLKLKTEFENLKNDSFFKREMEKKVSGRLYLSAKNTLKQLVEQNAFLPLEILFVDSWPENEIKAKNVISHLA